jgi:hypothetical protein
MMLLILVLMTPIQITINTGNRPLRSPRIIVKDVTKPTHGFILRGSISWLIQLILYRHWYQQ